MREIGVSNIPPMKIISFNVNGIRAIRSGGRIQDCIGEELPDILCLQEIKTQDVGDLEFLREWFPHIFISAADKKGYSGVALLCKQAPLSVTKEFLESANGSEAPPFTKEGRILTAEFPGSIYVISTYVPNSKAKLLRIEERLIWETWMRRHIRQLQTSSSGRVIVCGDFNVCHGPLDYWTDVTKAKATSPGLSPQEKSAMDSLISECDLVDTYRVLHPTERAYSFWSPWANCKRDNKGWRLDYILVSKELGATVRRAECLEKFCESDHCPIIAEL